MNYLFHIGRYGMFLRQVFSIPEKASAFRKLVIRETSQIGIGSLGIVTIVSIFMGAVITIQTKHNLTSPLVPSWAVGVVTRDSIIVEFAPSIIALILAGKVGSNIASQIGTMRVTEQIDALEVMGINAASYLAFPKILAMLIIFPFLVIFSMFLGIGGGWLAGTLSEVITTADFVRGLHENFKPFNVAFAMIKAYAYAFIITSVSTYHGYHTRKAAYDSHCRG